MRTKRRRLGPSLLVIVLGGLAGMLSWVLPTLAVTYHTHQITSNQSDCSNLELNNSGQLVWQRSDGDNEIYSYSNNTITPITNNSLDDRNPQLNDSGQIVWEGYDGTDYQIYTFSDNTTTQLTNDVSPDPGVFWAHSSPQINAGDHIVWMGVDQWTENYYTVTGYQLFLDGLQITFHPDPVPPKSATKPATTPR